MIAPRWTFAILMVLALTPMTGDRRVPDAPSMVDEAIERLRSSDRAERVKGISQLRAAGEEARRAWPCVVGFLGEPALTVEERSEAQAILEVIADPEDEVMSQAIVQILLRQLVYYELYAIPQMRCYALLARHERHLRRFVPQLRDLLGLDSEFGMGQFTPWIALALLARCGVDGLDALMEAVGNRKCCNRGMALFFLGDYGELARPAVPLLRDCLAHGNDTVCCDAAIALLRIDRPGNLESAVWRLGDLVDWDSSHARRALRVLRDLGPEAAGSVPALRRALQRPGQLSETLATLRAVGPIAADAIPDLRELLTGPTDQSVVDIAHTLWCVSPGDRAALNVLLDRAEHGDTRAIAALGERGRGVPGVWQALHRLRGKVRDENASALASALWRTAPIEENDGQQWDGREQAIEDLGDLIEQGKPDTHIASRVIGPGAARLIPRLRAMLDSRNESLVFRAVTALGEIGPSARSAVPALWQLATAEERNERMHTEAALAVARIDPRYAIASTPIVCRERGQEERNNLFRLAHFGGRARAAVPRLRELLTSTNHDTRHAAADALWRIDPDEARRLGIVRPALRLGEEARP